MRTSAMTAPLVVSPDGTSGPYIAVATNQLNDVLQALQAREVPVQVEEDAVLRGGMPVLSVINLGPDADIGQVQAILDRLTEEWRSMPSGRRDSADTPHGLIVKLDPQELQEFVRRLEAGVPGGWQRRGEIEESHKKSLPRAPAAYCFSKAIEPATREVLVWLRTRGPGQLYVSTIIALQEWATFGVEQYNQALADFQKTLIEPLARGLKARIFNYRAPAEPPLEEVLTSEAMDLLRSFAATAKKGVHASLVTYRWRRFIARTHLDDAVFNPDVLSSWLEDEGWPEEQRNHLVSEYKSGRGLLSVYDEEQAAQ